MMRSVSAAILCVLTCAAVSAQPVRVRGTRVSLDPPSGFSPAAQFAGFQNADVQSAIMVTELPGPASLMKRGMTQTALASRGMTLLESSTASVDGQDALLLRVRQASTSGEVLKWMLVAGDQTRTVMVVGTYPLAADAALGEAIKRSLLNARLGIGTAAPDPFEGLRFRVTPTPFLKVAGRVNDMLTLTETGTMTPGKADAALYFVGHSLGPVAIGDLRQFSETRLAQTTRTRGISDITGRPTRLDGLEAYELEANATDAQTGRRIRIYQTIAPDPGGYYIIQGIVSLTRAAAVVPEFKAVTRTFRRAAEH